MDPTFYLYRKYKNNISNYQYYITLEYIIHDGQGTSSGVFFPKTTEPIGGGILSSNFAVYPYYPDNKIQGEIIETVLSSSQIYEPYSMPNNSSIMIAKSNDNILAFKNAVGILKLKIKNETSRTYNLHSIKVTSTDKYLSGRVKIDMSTKEPIAVPYSGGNHFVDLLCNNPISLDRDFKSFNIVMPVDVYTKNDLTIQLGFDNQTENDPSTFTINRQFSIYRSAINSISITITTNGVNVDYSSSENESYVDLENEGDYNTEDLWVNKLISSGNLYDNDTRITTKDLLDKKIDVILLDEGYCAYLWAYNELGCVGVWNGSGYSRTGAYTLKHKINLASFKNNNPTYYYRLVVFNAKNTNIGVDEYTHIKFFNSSYYYNTYAPDEQQRNPRPILTFIDDDGIAEAANNWEQIYNEIGVSPTMALVTNLVGTSKRITWDRVEELRRKGFEFISHTHNHINLSTSSSTTISSDFIASKVALAEHNCTPDFVVYPGNNHNAISDQIVETNFKGGFWQGDYMNVPPLNITAINRYTYLNTGSRINIIDNDGIERSVYAIKTDEELNEIIDDAVLRGGWVVFMCHFRNSYSDGYYYDDSVKNSIIRLCRYAKSKGVRIMNVSDAFNEFNQN